MIGYIVLSLLLFDFIILLLFSGYTRKGVMVELKGCDPKLGQISLKPRSTAMGRIPVWSDRTRDRTVGQIVGKTQKGASYPKD